MFISVLYLIYDIGILVGIPSLLLVTMCFWFFIKVRGIVDGVVDKFLDNYFWKVSSHNDTETAQYPNSDDDGDDATV